MWTLLDWLRRRTLAYDREDEDVLGRDLQVAEESFPVLDVGDIVKVFPGLRAGDVVKMRPNDLASGINVGHFVLLQRRDDASGGLTSALVDEAQASKISSGQVGLRVAQVDDAAVTLRVTKAMSGGDRR